MHALIIPFRGPATAKSRLTPGLSDAARRQVARAMFQHVLNVACASMDPRRVVVVTGSRSAAAIARRCGAVVLREAVADHNEAVAQAVAHVRARGATTASIVAADLPLLEASDLVALERWARNGDIAIATDRDGSGTNAIAMPLSVPFTFRFGQDSLDRHVRQADKLGIAVRFVKQTGLALDVDTPRDLAFLDDPSALATLPTVTPAAAQPAPWSASAAAYRTLDEAHS